MNARAHTHTDSYTVIHIIDTSPTRSRVRGTRDERVVPRINVIVQERRRVRIGTRNKHSSGTHDIGLRKMGREGVTQIISRLE